jgi:phospholipid/cholesterol/gamma-HCH transport system substrate-binding protein
VVSLGKEVLRMKLSQEAKVGVLIFGTGILALVFAWIIGIQSPFQQYTHFYVTYQFAGGIEVGSPVRVSGIKVGKVEKIEFFSPIDPKTTGLKETNKADLTQEGQAIVPLKLKVSVRKDAAVGVRKDSQFFINLAGIIGERYIEVTPGHFKSPQVQEGDVVVGIDPPRIDQLISQSFDLAGKIKDIVEENKGDITRSIELLYKLSANLNKTLSWVDKSAVFKTDLSKLVDNLIAITSDMRKVTDQVHTPEGEKTLNLLYQLLWRLEPVDSHAIRTFFQKEGVKVKMF